MREVLRRSFPTAAHFVGPAYRGVASFVSRHRRSTLIVMILLISGSALGRGWYWYVLRHDPYGFPNWMGPPGDIDPTDPQNRELVRRFGSIRGPLIAEDRMILFWSGNYIDAPYQLETRGLAVLINGFEFSRGYWNGVGFIVDEPSMPNNIVATSRFNDLARGRHPSEIWPERMERYLMGSSTDKTLRRDVIEAYTRLPFVEVASIVRIDDPESWNKDGKEERLNVRTKTGDEYLLSVPSHLEHLERRDSVMASLRTSLDYVKEWKIGKYHFLMQSESNPYWTISLSPADECYWYIPTLIDVLESNSSPTNKVRKLRALLKGHVALAEWTPILEEVVRSYRGSPQLQARVSVIRKAHNQRGEIPVIPRLPVDSPETEPVSGNETVVVGGRQRPTTVSEAVELSLKLLEADRIDDFIELIVDPVIVANQKRESRGLESFVKWIRKNRLKTIASLKVAREQRPWFSKDEREAILSVYVPNGDLSVQRYRKYGNCWYALNLHGGASY